MAQIDNEQLAALWMQVQPTVAGYISSLVPDFHQADDILQNTAVVIVRKRASYDSSQPFLHWAISIAKFEVLKHRRDTAREKHRFEFDDGLIDKLTASYEEAAAELEPQLAALRYCLQKLKQRPREALALRHYQGLDPAEIAERLQLTVEGARALVYRARKSIRDCIASRLRQEDLPQ